MNLCLFRCTRDAQVEKVTISNEICFSCALHFVHTKMLCFFTLVALIAFFSLSLAIYGLLLQLIYSFINYSFCFLFCSGYRSTLFYIVDSRSSAFFLFFFWLLFSLGSSTISQCFFFQSFYYSVPKLFFLHVIRTQ